MSTQASGPGTSPATGKRSLIMAGGGLKVPFQAGVLQVWLDEADQNFQHYDASSGGVQQLAMLCSGMSGTKIADNWREFNPLKGVKLTELIRFFLAPSRFATSWFTLDAYRKNVFKKWGLRFDQIAAYKEAETTFNIYNFRTHELEAKSAADMTEDLLVAGFALPMWFPPVRIARADGNVEDLYIDSVFNTDANLEAAIERGAEEIWVIWTVSLAGEWHPGVINNYFQIIEACANGRFKQLVARIERSNSAIARNQCGYYPRSITLKILRAEVAPHYLMNLNPDRFAEMVNSGVVAARKWCLQNKVPIKTTLADPPDPGPRPANLTRFRFDETLRGAYARGLADCLRGYNAGRGAERIQVDVAATTPDLDKLLTWPDHTMALTGTINCARLGGRLPIKPGSTLNWLTDRANPAEKLLSYRIFFDDSGGHKMTLSGRKFVEQRLGGPWKTTTTIYFRIFHGHVTADQDPDEDADRQALRGAALSLAGALVGSGIMVISPWDFARHQPRMVFGNLPMATGRFARMFIDKLWDVYARDIVKGGPV